MSMLADMAAKTEESNVRRHFTQDEKDQIKDYAVSEGIVLMEKKAEFSEIKKTFNKAIKDFETAVKGALTDIKRGYTDTLETVYLIPDHDNDVMDVYDHKGVYLSSRPMFPNERQIRVIDMTQKAS
jgi:hypothetical protein